MAFGHKCHVLIRYDSAWNRRDSNSLPDRELILLLHSHGRDLLGAVIPDRSGIGQCQSGSGDRHTASSCYRQWAVDHLDGESLRRDRSVSLSVVLEHEPGMSFGHTFGRNSYPLWNSRNQHLLLLYGNR